MNSSTLTNEPNPNTTPENPPKPKKTRRSRHAPEPDWSAMVREKIRKPQNRVGQACDRCKLKRMRCSQGETGCAACLACGIPCKVTDRVSGETMVRGEVARMKALIFKLRSKTALLEEQVKQLEQKNAQLQGQMGQMGRMGRSYESYVEQCEADLGPRVM
ncbi:uncharacterized protein N7515_007026 [Penicillium bovifimosum]|uniref:Zn(2)-C6 fungal-type domain-containing protein n=1 Tax=Penicillium bovifimosum TaxID=126998 RepID=A0A9W9GVV4_9EURO|nr:uncharacterized protein N7515_007026 [Penicillium bovifimosum]KAJ5130987.1 hypothetical protein N7515_007026 [Penicillium bovifimosum]